MSENNIVEMLTSSFPDYIGDDAAVIPYSGNKKYLITKDVLIEDVHFRTSYFNANDLAIKVLNVNLSDIAAMGGKPLFALLGISTNHSSEYVYSFLENITELCSKYNISLIGGDTTRSPDKLFISLTLIGEAEVQKIKYRNRAMHGDVLCVVGNLGYAHLGFKMLESDINCEVGCYISSFLRPSALIEEGIWLANFPSVHAMMDISDGLYIDLTKMCESSGVGSEILLDKLQCTQDFAKKCTEYSLDPITIMLTGGEDYGLLFAINPLDINKISSQFESKFNYKINVIGKFVDVDGVTFIKNGEPVVLPLKSFSHFGEL